MQAGIRLIHVSNTGDLSLAGSVDWHISQPSKSLTVSGVTTYIAICMYFGYQETISTKVWVIAYTCYVLHQLLLVITNGWNAINISWTYILYSVDELTLAKEKGIIKD